VKKRSPAAQLAAVRWLEGGLEKAEGGSEMTRSLAGTVFVAVTVTVLGLSGCATKDDSVWGRVEAIDSPDISQEPGCRGDVPPVVTPGEAKQDSLNQLPDEDSEGRSSDWHGIGRFVASHLTSV
jgi:hypothetical protein